MGFLSRVFGTPSREDFAKDVIRTLRSQGERGEIAFDAATFSLKVEGGENPSLISLGNFYSIFARTPRGERQQFIVSFLRKVHAGFKPLPKNFAEARQRLLPNLRS